jgi:surfeit locus 1 family protein
MAVAAVLLFCAFLSLGTWQLHRRAWKLDLIARVEQRVHAPAVPPPPPGEWSQVTAANSEYRHVHAAGTFLNDSETLVQALTDLGAGFWVLTPLRLGDGTVVLVNRGFVPPEQRERASHGAAEVTTAATVTGLLRITEPKGWFLRRNDPAKNLWYSRDVQGIAAARGLAQVAPYFIDQEANAAGEGASGGGKSAPVGGLTVIAFRNTHLAYAITWYGLALLVAVGAWIVVREERRRA